MKFLCSECDIEINTEEQSWLQHHASKHCFKGERPCGHQFAEDDIEWDS
jgi:hypothetical protein